MGIPKPDRSTYKPNFAKSAQNDQIDIGWAEGTLSDGRRYRLELWAQNQLTCVTVFMASQGLAAATSQDLLDLVAAERVVWWRPGVRPSAGVSPFNDSAGQAMWSINIVIGDDGAPARADTVPVLPYRDIDNRKP